MSECHLFSCVLLQRTKYMCCRPALPPVRHGSSRCFGLAFVVRGQEGFLFVRLVAVLWLFSRSFGLSTVFVSQLGACLGCLQSVMALFVALVSLSFVLGQEGFV